MPCFTRSDDKSVDELKSPLLPTVYQIDGEPTVVINGVPNIIADCSSSSQLNINNSDVYVDPCFGEWMEGRDVRKLFGNRYYSGKVSKFDREMNWYRVVYEDGDSEDLYWHELEEVLVPLDISISLKKLVLQSLKGYKSSEELVESSRKSWKIPNDIVAWQITKSSREALSTRSREKAKGNKKSRK